eukprot:g2256.t1
MTSSVIEETMKRIQSHKGVEAILIVDNDGHVIQSNLKERSEEHAALLCQLTSKARSVVRTLDNTNDLTFLRIRSKKHEIMISPDKEHMLIVIQRSDGAASSK